MWRRGRRPEERQAAASAREAGGRLRRRSRRRRTKEPGRGWPLLKAGSRVASPTCRSARAPARPRGESYNTARLIPLSSCLRARLVALVGLASRGRASRPARATRASPKRARAHMAPCAQAAAANRHAAAGPGERRQRIRRTAGAPREGRAGGEIRRRSVPGHPL